MSSQSSRRLVHVYAALVAVVGAACVVHSASAEKKSLLRLDVASGASVKASAKPSAAAAPSASISPVSIKNYTSHSEVVIRTQGGAPKFSVQQLKHPERLVIDIDGERLPAASGPKTASSPYISAVRLGTHETKTRVVIDLKGTTEFTNQAAAQGQSVVVKVMPVVLDAVKKPIPEPASSDRAAPAPQIFKAPVAEAKRSKLALDEDVVVSGSSTSTKTLASLEESQPKPVTTEKQKGGSEKGNSAPALPVVRAEKAVVIPGLQQKVTEEPKKIEIKPSIQPVSVPAHEVSISPVVAPKQAIAEERKDLVAAQSQREQAREEAIVAAKVPNRAGSIVQSVALEGQGKQPSIVLALHGVADFSMDRTAPSEYVLKLRNTDADEKVLKQTLFASHESSGIRSVRVAADGDGVLVRIFTQPSSYLTARRSGDRLVVQETQDLAQIARDIRAQIAPSAAQDPKKKPAGTVELPPQAPRGPEVVTVDPSKSAAAKVDPTKAPTVKAEPTKPAVVSAGQPADPKPETPKNPGDPKTKGAEPAAVVTPAATATPAATKGKEARVTSSQRTESELAAIKGNSASYSGRLISLDLQDADIDSALRIIAEVSNLNIVAGDGVVGKVTLKLVDVPWDQALEVILKNAGLDKVLEGNVLRVAPVDKLKAERESFKQARVAEEELEPLSVKYMRISYAKASEIKALVETVLSERGSVAFDERSNQLVVKDVQKGLQNVTELIRKVDLRTPQILLETQIVEASRNLSRQLGSELGLQYIQSPATGNGTGLNFPSAIAIGGSADTTNPNSILGSAFPIATSATAGSAITMLFDSADGTKNLQLRLSQLEQEGQVRIVSKPAVATTNNKAAEIKSVEKFRVKLPNGGLSIASGSGAQSTGAGNVATQTIEAGIVLNVTPQASPDYYILLDIHAKSSSFGAEKVDGIPNEIERSASSSVLVSSGQTFALGGIYKITENDSISGVPFFKDIPVLGTFFRSSTTSNKDEELLFFITPRIVEGSFEDASMKVVS